jgi:hypothetical protein
VSSPEGTRIESHVFHDFDAFAASVRNVESRMMFRNAERRTWRHDSVVVGRVAVQRGLLGSGNIAGGQMQPDAYMLYLPMTHGIEYRLNGDALEPDSVGTLPPGSEFCFSTVVAHDWYAVSVPADMLDREPAGPSPDAPPMGPLVMRPDPDFDASRPAFYYARVIEIPTPRWPAHDAKRFGVEPPPGARMTITERAYTSPIWYTP